jgi:hypothetical protein
MSYALDSSRPLHTAPPPLDPQLASDTVATALGLVGSLWEAEAKNLTRDEVQQRLRAAELGGLTDAVWRGLEKLRSDPSFVSRDRSATPTLPTPDQPPTPSMARQPALRGQNSPGSRAQQLVPIIVPTHGRVPRSQESWQYYEGENECMGCLRAFRLVMYNLTGALLCLPCAYDVHRKA